MKQIGIWVGIAVIFIAGIWGLIWLVNSNSSSNVLSSQTINIPPISKDDIVSSDPQKAKAESDSAKATLVEYADFQCPACAYYSPIVKQLKKDFGDDLLIVYRFFPLIRKHQNAMPASQAAFAAGKQNKFWEMSDSLYENQEQWSESAKTKDLFTEYAKQLGLNIEQFTADFNADSTKKFITSQMNSGISIGINATPTFFVNGKKIENPRSYETFKQLIQDELTK